MGVSSFFKFIDDRARIAPVALTDIQPLCRNKNLLVDVYGSHYWKMKGIDKIADRNSKFKALDEMLNSYYSKLNLSYQSITFVLDGSLHQAKKATKLKRISGQVTSILK
jgi:hypothetical protein